MHTEKEKRLHENRRKKINMIITDKRGTYENQRQETQKSS